MAACLATTLILLAISCAGPGEDAGEAMPAGFEQETVRGPLSVRVRTDRDTMTLADRLHFTIEAEAPEVYAPELPRFGRNLESFLIRDASATQSSLVDGDRVRLSRTYVLEPLVSGEYIIPAMDVVFREKPVDGDATDGSTAGGDSSVAVHRLQSPEITLTVSSLLPEDVSSLEVVDIVGPREMPAPPLRWWGVFVAAGILVALSAAWIVVVRRREIGPRAVRVPAHVTAYAALKALVAEDLLGQGRVKAFYQRISTILRRYIEQRFDLHAPEQTTEEFLADLGRRDALSSRHKALLADFLTHCDLVKFAELQPGSDEIQGTFDSCKAFIEETREDRSPEAAQGGGKS